MIPEHHSQRKNSGKRLHRKRLKRDKTEGWLRRGRRNPRKAGEGKQIVHRKTNPKEKKRKNKEGEKRGIARPQGVTVFGKKG